MKLVVTGGGSGGHVYPALAVVEALRASEPDLEVAYVGGTTGIEAQLVPAAGLPFTGVTTRKLRKVVSPGTVGVLLALLKGYREAAAFLRAFRPDVAVSTGGYVAAATAIAAARQRVPTVILAPDAVPGRTNRWLARWASRVCVMFEETRALYGAEKTVVTGLPIRAGIVSAVGQEEARAAFGLRPDRFTLLVTGGSQGAQRLNEVVQAAVPLLGGAVQVIHQVGAKNALPPAAENYLPVPYLDSDRMPLAYRAADATVCRSGVGSLAEATANGLPMLMVPLPTAYADHQTANARAMERGGGGVLLPQAELTPERLAEAVRALLTDCGRRQAMGAASRSLGRPDAAARVGSIAKTLVQ